jgi:uncharacterized membrane protein
MNVKSPNIISKWQMGFNSAFKGLSAARYLLLLPALMAWKGTSSYFFCKGFVFEKFY